MLKGLRPLLKILEVMSSECPTEILPPDSMHLSAATGWMQLGNTDEALVDLDKISDQHRGHYEVLHIEWHIHAQRKAWERCAELGGYMVEQYPKSSAGWINQANSLFYLNRSHDAYQLLEPVAERFPKNEAIPYNLACYACQLGSPGECLDFLKEAAKRDERYKAMALADEDLKGVQDALREMGWSE